MSALNETQLEPSPEGMNPPLPARSLRSSRRLLTAYGNTLVLFNDGGEDQRVFRWLDTLPEWDRSHLALVACNKGSASLRWTCRPPSEYEHDIVVPGGDCWNVVKSSQVSSRTFDVGTEDDDWQEGRA